MRFERTMLAMLGLTCLVLSSVLPAPIPSDVLVVDINAGPYTQIWEALLAADEGDTILVHPGQYESFFIDDLSVTIVAESPGVAVNGSVQIMDVRRGKEVVLSHISILRASPGVAAGLAVVRCDGAVRFQNGGISGWNQIGALVLGSRDVVLTRCGINGSTSGDPGIMAERSNLTCIGCVVNSPGYPLTWDGVDGIVVSDCRLGLQRTSVTAGNGADGYFSPFGFGYCWGCVPPGEGGVPVSATAAEVELIEATLTSGRPGAAINDPCCSSYAPPWPPPVEQLAGTAVTTFAGPSLELTLPGTNAPFARENATLDIAAEGEPGETVILLVSTGARLRSNANVFGDLLVLGLPGQIERRVLGPSPQVTSLLMPDLTTIDSLDIHVQLFGLSSAGPRFGDARVITVLDDQF